MAAYHRVYDYACCHLQADCLEFGISSGPYARLRVWVRNLYLICKMINLYIYVVYKNV